MTETERAILRGAYARQIVHAAGLDDPRLEEALAAVPREVFLPPPPWRIVHHGLPGTEPVSDPLYLYQDAPVAIEPGRRLNNGQPSFVARLIAACALRAGEAVVQIGTGGGYYTALLARLVGETGRVTGIEIEPGLAARSAANLGAYPQVEIRAGDGTVGPLPECEAILVNAGASRPCAAWLDALRPGGRLVLPLASGFTTPDGHRMTRGFVFRILRDPHGDGYAAACLSPTLFYPCLGIDDPASEAALAEALGREGAGRVRRLHRTGDIAPDRCWLRAPDWCLAYD